MPKIRRTVCFVYGFPRLRYKTAIGNNDGSIACSSKLRVMGHQQNRPMILLIQFMQKRHQLFTGFFIQVSRRFIAKQHLGIVDERPGNGNPLLLSAGKLSRIMLEPINNAQPLGDLFKLWCNRYSPAVYRCRSGSAPEIESP